MRRKELMKLNDADEYDAFTGWRKWYTWRAGELKAIKHKYNRRVRRAWRREVKFKEE